MSREFKWSGEFAGAPALSPGSWAETEISAILSFRDIALSASGSEHSKVFKRLSSFFGGTLYFYVRLVFLKFCTCPVERRMALHKVLVQHGIWHQSQPSILAVSLLERFLSCLSRLPCSQQWSLLLGAVHPVFCVVLTRIWNLALLRDELLMSFWTS